MSNYELFDLEPPRPRSGPERHLVSARERRVTAIMEVAAKKDGQAKALAGVPTKYKEEFDRAILYLRDSAVECPKLCATFSIDDVIDLIGLPSEGQNKNNAVGALMAGAAKRGLIRAIGYTESKRAGSHGRAVRLWEGVK